MAALRAWWQGHRERRRAKLARRPDIGSQVRGAQGRDSRDPGGIAGSGGDGMQGGGF